MTATPTHSPPSRWAQVSAAADVRPVRIDRHLAANRYEAEPLCFDAEGGTVALGGETLTVVNLAEPADSGGALPDGTETLAVSAAGRWGVHVGVAGVWPARVVASTGGAGYTVRRQGPDGAGGLTDAVGAEDVAATNLAEVGLGPGGAVDPDTFVLVHAEPDGSSPGGALHLFDHPPYAKYLD
jgi:hypothetical protein